VGPTLLLIGFWLIMMRSGGMGGMMGGGGGGGRGGAGGIFSVGKAKPTIIGKEEKTGVLFKDVAGLAEAKVEVLLPSFDRRALLPAFLPSYDGRGMACCAAERPLAAAGDGGGRLPQATRAVQGARHQDPS
jgi:hypothetical protein